MCSVSDLLVKMPASAGDVFEISGRNSWVRKALYRQSSFCETMAICLPTGVCLAIGYFWKERARRWRFGLLIADVAAEHMLPLVRIAQLTLKKIADNGVLTVAEVNPQNEAGKRMARLVGFRRSKLNDEHVWTWRPQ